MRRVTFLCPYCKGLNVTLRVSILDGYSTIHRPCGRRIYPLRWPGLLPE
jgi:hypothetical protein